jgi:hypothetical protein
MTAQQRQTRAEAGIRYRPARLGHALRAIQPAASVPGLSGGAVRHGAWLTAVVTAGAVTAGVLLLGGSPAYAVTQNPDGTVTVSIVRPAGVQPANDRLHVLGDPVAVVPAGVVVPMGPGCPSLASLPKPHAEPPGKVTVRGNGSGGRLTVDAHGIPAGDTMLITARTAPDGGMQLAGTLISGPPPRCVSLPAPPPYRVRAASVS